MAVIAGLCPAEMRSVALTFDDLPLVGEGGGEEARRVNEAILASLAKFRARATGFVVEQRVRKIGESEGRRILGRWVQQGHELGNHTFSHPDLNDLTARQFQKEVERGEASFGQALGERGKKPRYLRFPYNHTGDTKEKHGLVADYLKRRGYQVAECTIDNADYEFARAYGLMLAGKDEEAASKLRAEYLAYTEAEIDYYSGLHKGVFGREIPHVMLLHVNRLNADLMDEILAIFARKGYRFVTLDAARADPAYRTGEGGVTKFGPMWGYRWARELGIQVNGSLETEPPAWVLNYGK